MTKVWKSLAAWCLILMLLPLGMTAVSATTFEEQYASMAVVPGSPADLEAQASASEPSSSSEPEPEPEPEPSSSEVTPSSSTPAPSSSSSRPAAPPASNSETGSEDESSNTSRINYPVVSSRLSSEGVVLPVESNVSEPDSSISLPSVGEVSGAGDIIASGIDVTVDNEFNMIGVISWVCIGLGVVVVIVVLLSTTRRPPTGGYGRKRYRRKPVKSKKKRLLNDKYYRNIRKY